MSKSGERAALIVAQMLAYAGKGRFFNEFIDLSGLARDFLREVAASVPAKIQLRSELAQSLPPVEGDRNQIRQLIGNLYLNALEAIGDASGIVTICTGSETITCGDRWRRSSRRLFLPSRRIRFPAGHRYRMRYRRRN